MATLVLEVMRGFSREVSFNLGLIDKEGTLLRLGKRESASVKTLRWKQAGHMFKA